MSPEFAQVHSHLNSIRGLNTKDNNIDLPSGRDERDEDESNHSSESEDSDYD